MKRSQREAAARGSTHLLRLSLPAVRSNGSFEGEDILAEGAAAPAILLCQAYRAVMAWALTPAAEHPGLFPGGAAAEARRLLEESTLPPELRQPMATVCELLDDPARADAGGMAEACSRIGEWAEHRGDAPATALRFMQAAATSSPNDGRAAYRAGYVARHQAAWDVAELWFRHSNTVSRRRHDWETHATAYLGLGNSYYRQGRFLPAQREHLKALRVARRHGLRDLQGAALHNLFTVAVDLGNAVRAEDYARAAFNAYGARHRTIPLLAHDIAYFWNTQAQYPRSLPVFQALLQHLRGPEERLRVLANMARAAGGVLAAEVFHSAWDEVWRLAPGLQGTTTLTTSLIELAHGAMSLAEWDLAREAAMQAYGRAEARSELDVIQAAEDTLASIEREQRAAVRERPAPTGAQRPSDDPFTAALVSSLEAVAAGA